MPPITTDPLIKHQIINFIIYTAVGVIYGLIGTMGAGTSGILVIPIILFSIVVLLFNLAFTFLGQLVFHKRRYFLIALLTPQLFALVIFSIIKTQRKYILDFNYDQILFGFLVLTTLLNTFTFFKIKDKVKFNE